MAVVELDEAEIIGKAHWSVFLPTIVIAVLFALLWALFEALDRGHTMPARFAFLVSVLATPLLALLSFLRYQTTRVVRTFDGYWIEKGWPSMTPQHVRFDEVTRVKTKSGPFGAGRLCVALRSGATIRIRDLAAVNVVAREMGGPASALQG